MTDVWEECSLKGTLTKYFLSKLANRNYSTICLNCIVHNLRKKCTGNNLQLEPPAIDACGMLHISDEGTIQHQILSSNYFWRYGAELSRTAIYEVPIFNIWDSISLIYVCLVRGINSNGPTNLETSQLAEYDAIRPRRPWDRTRRIEGQVSTAAMRNQWLENEPRHRKTNEGGRQSVRPNVTPPDAHAAPTRTVQPNSAFSNSGPSIS